MLVCRSGCHLRLVGRKAITRLIFDDDAALQVFVRDDMEAVLRAVRLRQYAVPKSRFAINQLVPITVEVSMEGMK